jgi:hypothetical protein
MKEKPTHCADCGDLLDFCGMCPHANPKDAARMSAPVNCGKTLMEVLKALHAPSQRPEAA